MGEKNLGGRPRKYTTKEEMEKKIKKYFKSCYKSVMVLDKRKNQYVALKDEKGRIVREQFKPFTITGLADALDMSRQSLLNYSNKDEFFDTISRAKRKCEMYAEERLFDKDGANGAKFSLSNNFESWKDKKDVEVEHDKPFEVNIKVVK